MIDDLKNHYGVFGENININMLHYEYHANNKREIELIKELTEIDFEDGKHLIYSISKKQLRKIKLGAIEGVMECTRIKKIIFHSEIVRGIERILELTLFKEISKEISKEIIKDIFNLKTR